MRWIRRCSRRTGCRATSCSQRSAQLRTPLVLRCIDDFLAGRRLPLAAIADERWMSGHEPTRRATHERAVRARGTRVIVGLSGGVDSAVAALLLREAGYDVQGLFMSNWDEDDAYCTSAQDYQDARSIARELGIVLHRVSFAGQYRAQVFEQFLRDYRAGRTPNPDVLCNREIKFGLCLRLCRSGSGAAWFATGHYARRAAIAGRPGARCAPWMRARTRPTFCTACRARVWRGCSSRWASCARPQVRERARRAGLRDPRQAGQHRHLLHWRAPVRAVPAALPARHPRSDRDPGGPAPG